MPCLCSTLSTSVLGTLCFLVSSIQYDFAVRSSSKHGWRSIRDFNITVALSTSNLHMASKRSSAHIEQSSDMTSECPTMVAKHKTYTLAMVTREIERMYGQAQGYAEDFFCPKRYNGLESLDMLDLVSRLRPCQRITAHGSTTSLASSWSRMDTEDDTTKDSTIHSKGYGYSTQLAELHSTEV
ncbi:uncharacterized protein BO96DRAFT_420100 [Aspergillus niger CBS 101883]|nr:uncharacterized protein BO96DRAFT_420100 [Aspergillus niger CBS 101883]PYH60085.1 hypothetical protein BO96DRAFT_420100 [Aspergillus niger CBS 101883]